MPGTVCGDPSHAPLLWFPNANELAEERVRCVCYANHNS